MKRMIFLILTIMLVVSKAYAAIDNERARRNTVTVRLQHIGMRRLLPTADASITVGDRAFLARAYSESFESGAGAGSSTGSNSASNASGFFILQKRRLNSQ